MKLPMIIIIPLAPVTKKNSQQMVRAGNRWIVVPSKAYKQYEKEAGWYMPNDAEIISTPINVSCTYYMPTRRRVDLVNLQEATLDILVRYGIIEDDNCRIVVSMDGSRVLYDKANPRTVIEIQEAGGGDKYDLT